MSKLYFYYGCLRSGKTIDLLKTCYNYEETGKKAWVFTSATDTRSGKGVVSSRIGLSKEATIMEDVFVSGGSFDKYLASKVGNLPDVILIDEAQFLSRGIVEQLSRAVDKYDLPIIAYGLKNDFKNNLFEGSEALLTYADEIKELKTMCTKPGCNSKATMNLRMVDGKKATEGEQISIGDQEYLPVCRAHYNNPENLR